MDEETRKVLATAKGLISGGWIQGSYTDGTGYCVYGALDRAATLSGLSRDDVGPIELVLADALGSPYLADWNDYPERTQAEVVALFDKVLSENPSLLPTEFVAA